MGMFDTMQQKGAAIGAQMGGTPNAMGQGFAQQKQPMQQPVMNNAFAQKQQMRANPMMKNKSAMPAMQNLAQNMGSMAASYGQGAQPNPMMQGGMMQSINKNAGMMGSRPQIQQRQQALKDQMAAQQAAQESPIGPSAESGLANLQTPYDMQQNPQEVLQAQAAAAAQQEPEVDMGSQDPREILRMQLMTPGGPNAGMGRPDVMPRGLGPSNMGPQPMMDENGLELRRGAR